MKKFIKIILCTALFSVPVVKAMADGGPSVSSEQSANVGGVQQKYQTSIGPSDFDAGQIAVQMTQMAMADKTPYDALVSGQNPNDPAILSARNTVNLWYMTPQPLNEDDQGFQKKYMSQLRPGSWAKNAVWPPVEIVTRWAAWASEQNLLDFSQYATLFNRCAASGSSPSSGGGEGGLYPQGLHPNYLPECAVRAYIASYAVGAFSQTHNLMGFVPLCEVTQANSCGIDPSFNPQVELSKYLAAKKAKIQEEANKAAYNTMTKHSQAYQRYECLKNVPYGAPATNLTENCKIILAAQDRQFEMERRAKQAEADLAAFRSGAGK